MADNDRMMAPIRSARAGVREHLANLCLSRFEVREEELLGLVS